MINRRWVVPGFLVGLFCLTPSIALSNPNEYGLYSETVPGITLDTDSYLGKYSDGVTLLPNTSDDGSTYAEGHKSLSTKVSLPFPGSYTGWFIQWGLPGAGVAKNMSTFANGSIRFWFKGPPALQNLLVVGVRSANVIPGLETSKVALSGLVPFDDAWHPVVIPISLLSGSWPRADLSQMEVLFNIAASGGILGSPQTFWIDNIRWDPNPPPGPLATMSITPTSPIAIPPGASRSFSAAGFDALGGTVDVIPTWSMNPSLGTLTPQGPSVLLTAQTTPISGSLTATSGSVSSSVNVDVSNINYTQAFNVYSDAGAAGPIGVSAGTAVSASTITLSELSGGSAPGSTHYMHAAWTLVNNVPGDAFAVWFVNEAGVSHFMQPYSDGYLQFFVRTTTDLQVSIRSANIVAGAERCKFRLSTLGIPLDGQWHQVTLSLLDFQTLEPLLDFSKINNFFTIGVLSNQIPVGSNAFDVANVKWYTSSTSAVDPSKVYAGLISKQNSSTGFALSFDNDVLVRSYTYDQALAAMTFTLHGDTALSKKIFDRYLSLYTGPGFAGFADTYNRDSLAIVEGARTAGPNAWLLLSLLHYRHVTGNTAYDVMIQGLASWLLSLQDPGDKGVRFGFNSSGVLQTHKSTEQNLDCVAAFKAYYAMTGNVLYQTAANQVLTWLETYVWDPALGRFDVGLTPSGQRDTDKGLDIYSWAPLVTSSYTATLAVAETDLRNTQTSIVTGQTVDGFDFGGILNVPATYKDAVWLEGTAQMVVAYDWVNDPVRKSYFMNQLNKAVVNTSLTTQGLPYAVNGGTGFGGFIMDAQNPAISSMAWYLFAVYRFNPFVSYSPVLGVLRNVSTNVVASSITWSNASALSGWVRADQYIELNTVPDSVSWGVQIYTDNKASDANPSFVTSVSAGQPGSNPAGLVDINNRASTIPLAWSIRVNSGTPPVVGDPNSNTAWVYFQDKNTPAIVAENVTAFANGASGVTVKNNLGAQLSQGAFTPVPNGPNAIYLEGNLGKALGGATYKTSTLRLEYYYP